MAKNFRDFILFLSYYYYYYYFTFLSSSGSSSFSVSCHSLFFLIRVTLENQPIQADKEKPHNLVSELTTNTPHPAWCWYLPDLIKYLLLGERRECVYFLYLIMLRKNKAQVQNLLQPALPACLFACLLSATLDEGPRSRDQ